MRQVSATCQKTGETCRGKAYSPHRGSLAVIRVTRGSSALRRHCGAFPKISSGNFSHTRGGSRSYALKPKTLSTRGVGFAPKEPRTRSRCGRRMRVCAPERGRRFPARKGLKTGRIFAPFLRLLSRRLLVVMAFAQALVVCRVDEQLPVTAKRHDMVNDGGHGPMPWILHGVLRCAFPAERFLKQVLRSKLLDPDRLRIPAVIIGAASPGLLRLMPVTPALTGEFRASWMSARPQRQSRHGLSPPRPRERKRAGANDTNALSA